METIAPKVSVCLLTCNHVRYIRQCIEGVLMQAKDARLEIVVGDDCSDDGTSEIVAEYAAENSQLITHLRHGTRIGGSANYLATLRLLNAPFIAYLDGDDYWLPGKLAKQIRYMEANPGCAAIYSNALTVGERGEPIGLFNNVKNLEFTLAELLRRGNFLNNSSMMFRAPQRQAIFNMSGPLFDYGVHL
jgi:glycosyltransferase involved in cell wall biosynthesis